MTAGRACSRRGTRRSLSRMLLATAQLVACIALVASTVPAASGAAVEVSRVQARADGSASLHAILQRRHGDEDHEDVDHSDVATQDHIGSMPIQEGSAHALSSHNEASSTHTASSMQDSHAMHDSVDADGHRHTHSHAHAANPYDGLADAAHAGASMVAVPSLAHVQHGHAHHGHGGEAPLRELNETTILRWKGPEPLSYIEWDFAYGLGKTHELQRFLSVYDDGHFIDRMGVSDGQRYRRLIDEHDDEIRKEIILDLRQRVQSDPEAPGRHRFVLILHVLGCVLSCFVLLPAALALRAASSSLAPLASLLYLVTLASSLFCSVLYKAMTPRLYPSNAHSGMGWAVFWLSLVALGGDVLRLLQQAVAQARALRGSSQDGVHFGTLLHALYTATPRHDTPNEDEVDVDDAHEGHRMLADTDMERLDRSAHRQGSSASSGFVSPSRSVHFEEDEQHPPSHPQQHIRRSSTVRSWRRDLPSPSSTLLGTPRTSVTGDAAWTLAADKQHGALAWREINAQDEDDDDALPARRPKRFGLLRAVLRYTHVTVARSIPVLSFAAAYTGLSVYTGSCRAPYQNGCLAHGIKGGIFLWYGLLSFGRYLGAYADLGWAWNRKPRSRGKKASGSGVSAEWVECFVIFFYGITNTWMERFGAKAGDPYSVKQVQHISIAVMFWFAGLMGLVLETKSLKALLAYPVALKQAAISRRSTSRTAVGDSDDDGVVAALPAPPSYSASFNPFPALVIGVTGVAMAAHHQDYEYEVAIHALWGNLLAGFSVLRIMTYVFLWLRPPTSSVLPSRPPTEALASFSLTCGGLVFMLSSEEVSFVAMRNGFGDFMMILNATVAIVSLLFCGITALMVLKAWAVKREHRRARRQQHQRTGIHLDDDETRIGRTSERVSAPQEQQAGGNTFVIGAEDDEADEKRQQFSSSPEPV